MQVGTVQFFGAGSSQTYVPGCVQWPQCFAEYIRGAASGNSNIHLQFHMHIEFAT